MDTPNGAVFRRAYAQDDTGLENEAESILLDGRQLFLEKDYYFSNHMDSNTAPAVLIYADQGRGFLDSRDADGKIDTLEVGPETGNGPRILILDQGRDIFVHQDVQMRRFLEVWKDRPQGFSSD